MAGAQRLDSSLRSERRRQSRADSFRLRNARASMLDQSSASACSTTGANSCSNAQGSVWPNAAIDAAFLVGLCIAASIHMASSIHAGFAAEALRRTVANLDST